MRGLGGFFSTAKPLHRIGVAIILAAGFTLTPTTLPAQGQLLDPVTDCFEGSMEPMLDVLACDMAIEHWDLEAHSRATLLVRRGRALARTGRPAEAFADFDAALALNPISAAAHHERGLLHHDAGDFDRAKADFDAAISLSPNIAEIRRDRGTTLLFLGDIAAAAGDLERAAELNPQDRNSLTMLGLAHYVQGDFETAAALFERDAVARYAYRFMPLWRYLSAARQGVDLGCVLADERAELPAGEWPADLLDLFLGASSEVAVLARIDTMPATLRPTRLAEAHLFMAERARLARDTKKARRHLDAALGARAERSIEQALARAIRAHHRD